MGGSTKKRTGRAEAKYESEAAIKACKGKGGTWVNGKCIPDPAAATPSPN